MVDDWGMVHGIVIPTLNWLHSEVDEIFVGSFVPPLFFVLRENPANAQRHNTNSQLPPHGPAAHQVVECIHDMNGNHVIQKVVAL